MKPVLLLCLLFATAFARADQSGEYYGVNPASQHAPDCHVAWGPGLGLGGACFEVPANATRVRVTLQDDVLGPGFGALGLCEDDFCRMVPICGGVAEGTVPAGTDRATVVAWDATAAWTFCGLAGLTWAPTHGTITLAFTSAL